MSWNAEALVLFCVFQYYVLTGKLEWSSQKVEAADFLSVQRRGGDLLGSHALMYKNCSGVFVGHWSKRHFHLLLVWTLCTVVESAALIIWLCFAYVLRASFLFCHITVSQATSETSRFHHSLCSPFSFSVLLSLLDADASVHLQNLCSYLAVGLWTAIIALSGGCEDSKENLKRDLFIN